MKIPSVAVLLAAYNGERWIEEQIKSILIQKNIHVHIFISVDLSSDDTFQLCTKIEKSHNNIELLKYGQRFGSPAKNFYHLIKEVNINEFDYIALSDQDDIWLQNKLSCAIEEITSNNLDGYSSDVIAIWSDERQKLVKKSYPKRKFDYYFEGGAPGCTFVLPVDSMQNFQNFLINNWTKASHVRHDWLIYAFIRSQDGAWLIDCKPLMKYRQHDTNIEGFNSGIRAYLKRLSMIKSGWYSKEVKKIYDLVNEYDSHLFKMNKWFLIRNFIHLRRRKRDSIFLLVSLLTSIFII